MTEFKKEDSLGSLPEAEQEAYLKLIDEGSQFEPRDSLELLEHYNHPKYVEGVEGQGVYVMLQKGGRLQWSISGNNLLDFYQRDPSAWLSGPIWLPQSPEDHARFKKEIQRIVDRY